MTDTVNVPRDVRQWQFHPIVMPLTKGGEGPAVAGEIESLTWEVWDRYLQCHASFENLPDAINDCLHRNALAAAPKAEPVSDPYKLEFEPCYGCGANEPSERCLGCAHDFQVLNRQETIDSSEAPKVEQEPVMVPAVFWSWLAERGLANDDPDLDWNDIVEILNEHENEIIHPATSSELLEALREVTPELTAEFSNIDGPWCRGQMDVDAVWSRLIETQIEAIAKHKGPQS